MVTLNTGRLPNNILKLCQSHVPKLSLYRLAKDTGLSYSTIHDIAHCRTHPGPASLNAICSVLHCSVADIFAPEIQEPTLAEAARRHKAPENIAELAI